MLKGLRDMRMDPPVLRRLLLEAVGALVLSIAIEPLLTVSSFWSNWADHVWYVAYFREYFLIHSNFPELISTDDWVASPMPLFYGYLFYPFLAWLSIPLSVTGAVKFASAALIVLPYLTWRWFLRGRLAAGLQIAISLIVVISIYQLTNLYNRGALTEFFAFQLVLAGVPLLLYFIHGEISIQKVWAGLAGVLLLGLALGSHPITGLIVACVGTLAIPGILLLTQRGDVYRAFRRLPWIALFALLLFLLLGGWMAAMIDGGHDLAVSNRASTLYYFEFDRLVYRLLPYPVEPRTLQQSITYISSPFLSAPLNLAGLLIFLALGWRFYLRSGKSRASLCFLIYWIGIHVYLVSTSLAIDPGPRFIYLAEFAYRLVNASNLWIALGVLIVIQGGESRPAREDRYGRFPPFVMGLCAGIFLLGLIGKVQQTHLEYSLGDYTLELQAPPEYRSPKPVAKLIGSVPDMLRNPLPHNSMEYSQPGLFGGPDKSYKAIAAHFVVNPNMTLQPLSIILDDCAEGCLVKTDAIVSKYVRFVVERAGLGTLELPRVVAVDGIAGPILGFAGLILGNGDYTLRIENRVPTAVRVFRAIGILATVLLFAVVTVLGVWVSWRRLRIERSRGAPVHDDVG